MVEIVNICLCFSWKIWHVKSQWHIFTWRLYNTMDLKNHWCIYCNTFAWNTSGHWGNCWQWNCYRLKPTPNWVTVRVNNHMHDNKWHEITYPFPNSSGCTIEVREWTSTIFPTHCKPSVLPTLSCFILLYLDKKIQSNWTAKNADKDIKNIFLLCLAPMGIYYK